MSEKTSGSADKINKIITIGGMEGETRNLANALASDYFISVSPDVMDAADRMTKESFSAIIFNLADSESDLVNILQTLKQLSPDTPIVVIGNAHDTRLIVKAIKAGAYDFITRPYPPEKIKLSVRQALDNRSLKNEIDYLRREQDIVYDRNRIIAVSPAMQNVIRTIKRLSQADSTILVTGETGTGKSFLSGNIHFNSPRCNKPFIGVNCANIPETLLESELFGHNKGAFTGADKTRTGRFEQASGGTIFLDEFCELGSGLQAKLLRAIEQKSFERLGSNKTIRADTRIIAATNRDIEALVRAGKFREDLYYRINVLRIHMPPLRERLACIEPLANYLLMKLSRAVKKRFESFDPEVIEMFRQYPWPGNIRQLSNVIERAILLEDDRVIRQENISLPDHGDSAPPSHSSVGLKLSEDQEKLMISKALEENLWIQKDAARQLGITPRALNYRIKKLGITHSRWRKNK
ncbi:MAG: sigma-54 dependent transcriptional regulator [Desulfobacterales bacterium]